MKRLARLSLVSLMLMPVFACPISPPESEKSQNVALACAPTHADALSPSYKPNAPMRSVVGQGHVVTGTVRSSRNCAPIVGVKLELWSESPSGGHPDQYRATVYTDLFGRYRFECAPTDHIHMQISAAGYHTLASNAYHSEGRTAGTFDIVLVPTNQPVMSR
jgi:protocatechuate 3,4-dioxygenase beta subunit